MLSTLAPIAKGILIGLGAAVPIGPVNVEMARRTLRSGFRSGLALGAGAVSVDVFFASLSCLSLGRVLDHRMIYWPVTIGGIILLTWLGIQCLRAAFSKREIQTDDQIPAASLRNGYLVGLMMTSLNPMTLAFWFVVLPATAGSIAGNPGRQLPLICLGVFIGTLGWVHAFAGTLAVLGSFRRRQWLVIADTLGGITL